MAKQYFAARPAAGGAKGGGGGGFLRRRRKGAGGGGGDSGGLLPPLENLGERALGLVHAGLAMLCLHQGLKKGPYVCLVHIALADAASVALLHLPAAWGGQGGGGKEKRE